MKKYRDPKFEHMSNWKYFKLVVVIYLFVIFYYTVGWAIKWYNERKYEKDNDDE